ncbi:MAG: hypothetical protein Q8N44_13865 [Rubrivivax sp.]|nr:hypothetical protein [Rubrivivax sp.]
MNRQRCALAALGWLLASAAALADCAATHPRARVTEALAQPRYASCDAVRQDYAEQIADQVRLLGVLRPAYQRKLERGAAASAAVDTRLRQYDDSSRRLHEQAKAWSRLRLAAEAASMPTGSSAAARQRLKDSRALGQALNDRITSAVDTLLADETTAYCKLDFGFRVGNGLQTLLADCLKGD